MIIKNYGHACFKLRSTEGTVVTDPYQNYVGFDLPNLSADVVTVSCDAPDHNNYPAIAQTTRRNNPFIIDHPGEYEVENISVFVVQTYRDKNKGVERGDNLVCTFLLDGLRVCHLGALGHELDEKTIKEIGLVDILFVPVGGGMTLGPKQAVSVARSLEPNIVIPMHYKTKQHDEKVFGELATLEDFLQAFETEVEPQEKINISGPDSLPEEMEVVVLRLQ
ncbi:MAG: Zn-dependent hydrolase [Candidatus Pacebacteria bacterium]|nr:Zn-dependent hydrolase [Candidatus Paceibacterota bacterium]